MANSEVPNGYRWDKQWEQFVREETDSATGIGTTWRREIGRGVWINGLAEGEQREMIFNNHPGDGPSRRIVEERGPSRLKRLPAVLPQSYHQCVRVVGM